MLRDLPYTGVGLDAFPAVQSQFYPGLRLGPEPHAHNLYLQIALDLGLPGLGVFLWLMGVVALQLVHAARRRPQGDLRAVLAAASAALAAFLVSGWVDTIWTAKPALLLWAFLGLVSLACRDRCSAPVARPNARPRRIWRRAGILLLAVTLGMFILSGAGVTNWVLVQAHRSLYRVRAGEAPGGGHLLPLAWDLEGALARKRGSPTIWRTLGSLYAWAGQPQPALTCLERAVVMDVDGPLQRYAFFEMWGRRMLGRQARELWQDLLWIYESWMHRFPDRAEGYVQVAIVWESVVGDSVRARRALELGLANGARPEGLLMAHLARLVEQNGESELSPSQ